MRPSHIQIYWLLAIGLFMPVPLGSCATAGPSDSDSSVATTNAVAQQVQLAPPSWTPSPATTRLEQLPPPGPTDEVLGFNTRRGAWELALLEDVDAGGEFIHDGRLFRLRGKAGLIQWVNDVDVERLAEADATWDPASEHRYPGAEDVVYVTGDAARHAPLFQVRDDEQFAFQGRIFEARVHHGEVSVRPTGLTRNRVAETFSRYADTLIELTIEYVEAGVTAAVSGTPEHPFFVPAVDDYVAMDELTPGTVLRTDDGSRARVVGSVVRHGNFEVSTSKLSTRTTILCRLRDPVGLGCWCTTRVDLRRESRRAVFPRGFAILP